MAPPTTRLTAIVTGGSAGIGAETVRQLARRGRTVVLACRDVEKGERVSAEMSGDIRVRQLDLADLESVHRFVDGLDIDALDALVNNAGVLGGELGFTADGYERQFGTNHLGHFALTGLLLPRLLAARRPHVVTITSVAAQRAVLAVDALEAQLLAPDPYEPMQVYARTKLANQVFTAELHRRARPARVHLRSIAAHPGIAATGMFSTNLRNRGQRFTPGLIDLGQRVVFQSAAKGAECSVRAATDEHLHGAEMIAPRWGRQSRGQPIVVPLVAHALDRDLGAALWDLSERLSGVTYGALSG